MDERGALPTGPQVAYVAEALKPGVRVTLEMGEQPRPHRIEGGPLGKGVDALAGSVVLPSDPRAKSGTYWGYTVRIASGLSAVFSGCPYQVCCGQHNLAVLRYHLNLVVQGTSLTCH